MSEKEEEGFKVVDLAQARAKRSSDDAPLPPKLVYFVRVEISQDDEITADLLDLGDTPPPNVLRAVAADLRILSWWLRTQAQDQDPNPSQNLLAEVQLFESSRMVTRHLPERFTNQPQAEWLRRRFNEAIERITRPEANDA